MATQNQHPKAIFFVMDAMDGPHRGRILRLRLQSGNPPTFRDLKSAILEARSPEGEAETLKVIGFFLPGGRPSDARLARTGKVDLIVEMEGEGGRPMISAGWEVTGPE